LIQNKLRRRPAVPPPKPEVSVPSGAL
jgi:hypothetical protein